MVVVVVVVVLVVVVVVELALLEQLRLPQKQTCGPSHPLELQRLGPGHIG